jgi:hypothetical protein
MRLSLFSHCRMSLTWSLSSRLVPRWAPTPVRWREPHDHEGRLGVAGVSIVQGVDRWAGFGSYREQACSRTWHCPARPEPVKGAYGVGFAADP